MLIENYSAPELKLVGTTDDTVFGLGGVGADYLCQMEVPDMEFAAD